MPNPSDDVLQTRVSEFDPTRFENLALDLVRAAGIRNLVWRTPGADGGRDIEGEHVGTDPSGSDFRQKWYVECKRYSSSVDWPTVWNKLAYADSHGADVFLLITTSQPSPQCETEICGWNEQRRRPSVRVWRGYDLPRLLRINRDVAAAHGLAQHETGVTEIATNVALTLSKLAQTAHAAWAFESDPDIPLTSAATLAELLHQRLYSLALHGRFFPGAKLQQVPNWPWLTVRGDVRALEEASFRAIVSTIRHVLYANDIECFIKEKSVELVAPLSRLTFSKNADEFLRPVLQISLCDDFQILDDRKLHFSLRG